MLGGDGEPVGPAAWVAAAVLDGQMQGQPDPVKAAGLSPPLCVPAVRQRGYLGRGPPSTR